MDMSHRKKIPTGLASRVIASIVIFFAWLAYAVYHVAFLWSNFSTIQNLALLVITFLIGAAILGAMWVWWGINLSKKYTQ